MNEKWTPILGFPGYSVSTLGHVRNDKTERILETNLNQYDVLFVGLMRDGVQYHRSVAKLVARAFVEKDFLAFDTPINLNGDRTDCRAENLVWRPRWFAIRYNRQFQERSLLSFPNKLRNTKTGEVLDNSWACAIKYGLLERDLVLAVVNKTYVWPLYIVFEAIPQD